MGDGLGSFSIQNPNYTYLSSGNYLAMLHVISDHGCQNNVTLEVIVNSLPIPRFNMINEQCQGEVCYFEDISFGRETQELMGFTYDAFIAYCRKSII